MGNFDRNLWCFFAALIWAIVASFTHNSLHAFFAIFFMLAAIEAQR